jgi:hypothetical protein
MKTGIADWRLQGEAMLRPVVLPPLSAMEVIVTEVIREELLGFLFIWGLFATGTSLLWAHLGRLGGKAHKVGLEGMLWPFLAATDSTDDRGMLSCSSVSELSASILTLIDVAIACVGFMVSTRSIAGLSVVGSLTIGVVDMTGLPTIASVAMFDRLAGVLVGTNSLASGLKASFIPIGSFFAPGPIP